MTLETVNKLYLELSQFVTARTERELALAKALEDILAISNIDENGINMTLIYHAKGLIASTRQMTRP